MDKLYTFENPNFSAYMVYLNRDVLNKNSFHKIIETCMPRQIEHYLDLVLVSLLRDCLKF